MKLHAFRVQGFRSVFDTGFQELSSDGITTIIGQNESGKSSLLEALVSFYNGKIKGDDIRSDGTVPVVTCIFKLEKISDVFNIVSEELLPQGFATTLKKLDGCLAFKRTWNLANLSEPGELSLENENLSNLWPKEQEEENGDEDEAEDEEEVQAGEVTAVTESGQAPVTEETPQESDQDTEEEKLSVDEFVDKVITAIPVITAFIDNSLLPKTIDLEDLLTRNLKAPGYKGAVNYLQLIGLTPQELNTPSDIRLVENKLDRLNAKITAEFQKYWTQVLGQNDKISLSMELKYHGGTNEKLGKPYLAFWIKDRNERLYPEQRSQGVRWFISFYLQLEATSNLERGRVLLIDEPGSNLHAKAQQDILQILEKIKDRLQVVFTTHSPYLLDIKKVYRVLAVQRVEKGRSLSDSEVITYRDLGSATTDTLLPLYTSMGVDISHQRAIDRENNVLLEEVSAFFYLQALWKLFGMTKSVHFLPATGCSNVPMLANLMLGWGLKFIAVVDDDPAGRRVYKELSDSKVTDAENLLKITGCNGIEDLFSTSVFATIILKQPSLRISSSPSEHMKEAALSKPVVASEFLIGVESGTISKDLLDATSIDKIETLLNKIDARLA